MNATNCNFKLLTESPSMPTHSSIHIQTVKSTANRRFSRMWLDWLLRNGPSTFHGFFSPSWIFIFSILSFFRVRWVLCWGWPWRRKVAVWSPHIHWNVFTVPNSCMSLMFFSHIIESMYHSFIVGGRKEKNFRSKIIDIWRHFFLSTLFSFSCFA